MRLGRSYYAVMVRVALVAAFVSALPHVFGEALLRFDRAVASSTHSAGTFSADAALSKDSGYWCSAGNHAPGQAVTWTGSLGTKQKALGVKLQWSYGPGELKVLTSSDGGNFEEAACWRAAGREEASYEETIMFDAPHDVKAVALVMRSPRPWGYFGLSSVALLSEPGSVMVVSGVAASAGELCLVAADGRLGARGCVAAVSAGLGEELFKFNERSQLESTMSGLCVAIAGEGTVNSLVLQSCLDALEANDGRSVLKLTPTGQLKFSQFGNYCVRLSPQSANAVDCGEEQGPAIEGDEFFLAPVPRFARTAVDQARDAANLLVAAAARQSGLLRRLQAEMPKLSGCQLSLARHADVLGRPLAMLSQGIASGLTLGGQEDETGRAVYDSLGVDMVSISQLLSDTGSALASASAHATA